MYNRKSITTGDAAAGVGISQANPGVVHTSTDHLLTNGDTVYIDGVAGMTEVNDLRFTATVVDADEFSIGVDTTGYGAWTSGGFVYKGEYPKAGMDVLKDFVTDPTAGLPFMQNNSVNGVPEPNFPYRTQTAATAGDCDLLPAGTVSAIYDDGAIGGCAETNGVLDGGGTATSVCVCDGAGLWHPIED
jgi:hypothetical protein